MINTIIQKAMVQVPKRLIYFAVIQLVSVVTTGKYLNTNVPELGAMEAIGRYEELIK